MRELIETSRKWLAPVLVGVAAMLLVGGASGASTVTIGQTDAVRERDRRQPRVVRPVRGCSRDGLRRAVGQLEDHRLEHLRRRLRPCRSVAEHDGLPT